MILDIKSFKESVKKNQKTQSVFEIKIEMVGSIQKKKFLKFLFYEKSSPVPLHCLTIPFLFGENDFIREVVKLIFLY